MGAALRLPEPDPVDVKLAVIPTSPTIQELQARVEQLRRIAAQRRMPTSSGQVVTQEDLWAVFEAKLRQQAGLPPSADPAHLRERGESGETAAVFVRASYPIGDWSLITCEDLDDATRVYEFGAPGEISQGAKGSVRYVGRSHAKLQGWVFDALVE